MAKKILTTILIFFTFFCFSQQRKTMINGKVLDSLGVVKNANIINLKTNQGTFSSDNGIFRIFVSEGDSLQISSIQHITKKIIIKKQQLKSKTVLIKLKSNIYVLDEFDLKRHNLTGRLGIDSKSVPIDKKEEKLRKVLDFSMIDFTKKNPTIDDNIRAKAPIINTVANSFEGISAGASATIPFKHSERLWALRKKLAQKKAFPYKILSELGEKFFFDKLKIPTENYFHFLEYCNPLGIEDLHNNGKLLEIIKILQAESISYLKIIKKE